MADISDVMAGLVTTVAGILFPGTSYTPGALATSAGVSVKVYRGWPTSERFDEDIAAGRAHVSVFADGGSARDTTRYMPQSRLVSERAPTITATVSGSVVTIGGTITVGDVIGITAGERHAGTFYGYAVQAGETIASIAAMFADVIPGASAAAGSGGAWVLTIAAPRVAARTTGPITSATEVRRQSQGVRVTVWAPTPAIRDALGAAIDAGIAGLRNAAGNLTRAIAAGSDSAMIAYRGSTDIDMTARDRVWRRDLLYTAEYPTSLIETTVRMLACGGAAQINGSALEPIGGLWRVAEVLTTVNDDEYWMDQAGHLVGEQAT